MKKVLYKFEKLIIFCNKNHNDKHIKNKQISTKQAIFENVTIQKNQEN